MAIVALIATAGVVVPGATSPANAAGGRVRSWPHGLCLDGDSYGGVFANTCANGPNQQWSMPSQPENVSTVKIVHARSGFCLASNRPGVVYNTRCDPTNNTMIWARLVTARPDGKAVYRFFNKQTNEALACDSSGRVFTTRASGHNQDWSL